MPDYTPRMSHALARSRNMEQQWMEEGAKLTQPGPSCRGVGNRGCDPREAVVPKLGPGLLLSIPSLIVFPFPSRVLPCLFGCCISPQRHCLSPRVLMHVECPGQSACTSPISGLSAPWWLLSHSAHQWAGTEAAAILVLLGSVGGGANSTPSFLLSPEPFST